jgi:hypothetical protein
VLLAVAEGDRSEARAAAPDQSLIKCSGAALAVPVGVMPASTACF